MATAAGFFVEGLERRKRVAAYARVNSIFHTESFLERLFSTFFPVKSLGRVDNTSLNYAYRLSRTEGYERNLAEINLAVAIAPVGTDEKGRPVYVKVGEAKPTYVRGTRESRDAQFRGEI